MKFSAGKERKKIFLTAVGAMKKPLGGHIDLKPTV
jgi:hypothetical protein